MLNKWLMAIPLALCVACCGYASENLLDEVGRDLPSRSSKRPIRVVRDVMPGQMVHVKFHATSENRPDAKVAFSLAFFDVDGDECGTKYSDVSYLSKFTTPASKIPQIGEKVEIKRIAPPYAVSMKILLRNSVDDAKARLESFDLDVRSPSMLELLVHSNVWWRYMPWLAVAVFVIVFAVGVKRLHAQESELKHRVRGMAVVFIVAMFVAYAAWCLGDVFASDHKNVIQGFLVFSLVLFVLYSMLDGLGEESFVSKHPVLCLSIVSMLIHIVVIVLCNRFFHQQMTSDSLRALKSLEAGTIHIGHVGNNANFAYWCNYELLLSIVGIVVGPHLYVGQVINALCCVGMLYPIYELSRVIVNRKAALFATVSFACYPTNYFHSTLLIQDYPCGFMLCWAMWFMWRNLQVGMFTRKGFLYALMCGSILGFSQLLKPISPIVLIAMVFCLVASVVGNKGWHILKNAVAVSVVVVSFAFVSGYGQEVFRRIAEPYQIAPKKMDMLTRVLSVGLDVKGRGKNTKTLVKRYWSNTEEENKRLAHESIRTDYVHYPVLAAEKFDRVYGSEEGLRRWFNVSIGKRCRPWFYCFVENYYYLFRILALMGAIGFALSCFARKISDQIFTIEMLMALFICGFFLMLMISEAQGRYRVPTHPASFIMISYLAVFAEKCMAVLRQIRSRFMRGGRS